MAKFEEHMMYGDGEARKAETNAEHLELKEKGWGHKKPSGFKLREVHYAGPLKCWKSHERKPGTTAEHLDLKEKGWGHKKRKGFKLREVNSPMKCWKTHKRKPGTKEFSDGSCIPK